MYKQFAEEHFIDNKYSRTYFRIINVAASRVVESEYTEMHHILPSSIYPEYSDRRKYKWNMVRLTPKQHYVCHLLLTKAFSGANRRKMVYAFWGMNNQRSRYQMGRYSGGARSYQYSKVHMAEALSLERKGVSIEQRYGPEKAADIRTNMKTRKTRASPSNEERAVISKRISDASRSSPWKRGFQLRQNPPVTCIHCHREMDKGNHNRHHGDNCKSKPDLQKDVAAY